MSVANNSDVGAGGTLCFPPRYPVEEYLSPWLSRLDARRFVILPAGSTISTMVCRFERETACTG